MGLDALHNLVNHSILLAYVVAAGKGFVASSKDLLHWEDPRNRDWRVNFSAGNIIKMSIVDASIPPTG